MDVIDRNQLGSLLAEQFGHLEVGYLMRPSGQRPPLLPQQRQIDPERGRVGRHHRVQHRQVARFAQVRRLRIRRAYPPTDLLQNRRLAHTGLPHQDHASRPIVRGLVDEPHQRIHMGPRLVEIDPERLVQRTR